MNSVLHEDEARRILASLRQRVMDAARRPGQNDFPICLDAVQCNAVLKGIDLAECALFDRAMRHERADWVLFSNTSRPEPHLTRSEAMRRLDAFTSALPAFVLYVERHVKPDTGAIEISERWKLAGAPVYARAPRWHCRFLAAMHSDVGTPGTMWQKLVREKGDEYIRKIKSRLAEELRKMLNVAGPVFTNERCRMLPSLSRSVEVLGAYESGVLSVRE